MTTNIILLWVWPQKKKWKIRSAFDEDEKEKGRFQKLKKNISEKGFHEEIREMPIVQLKNILLYHLRKK